MIIGIVIFIIWYIIGLLSFIFWWTKEFDFTTDEIGISICAGFIGPIAFFSGWIIHGNKHREPSILIKRR